MCWEYKKAEDISWPNQGGSTHTWKVSECAKQHIICVTGFRGRLAVMSYVTEEGFTEQMETTKS